MATEYNTRIFRNLSSLFSSIQTSPKKSSSPSGTHFSQSHHFTLQNFLNFEFSAGLFTFDKIIALDLETFLRSEEKHQKALINKLLQSHLLDEKDLINSFSYITSRKPFKSFLNSTLFAVYESLAALIQSSNLSHDLDFFQDKNGTIRLSKGHDFVSEYDDLVSKVKMIEGPAQFYLKCLANIAIFVDHFTSLQKKGNPKAKKVDVWYYSPLDSTIQAALESFQRTISIISEGVNIKHFEKNWKVLIAIEDGKPFLYFFSPIQFDYTLSFKDYFHQVASLSWSRNIHADKNSLLNIAEFSQILDHLPNIDTDWLDGFGSFLENLIYQEDQDKKLGGAYYTPSHIAKSLCRRSFDYLIIRESLIRLNTDNSKLEAIISKIPILSSIEELYEFLKSLHVSNKQIDEALYFVATQAKVLDPACGAGEFLYSSLVIRLELLDYLRIHSSTFSSYYDESDQNFLNFANSLNSLILRHFGVDLNPIAIYTTFIRLFFLQLISANCPPNLPEPLNLHENFLQNDFLLSNLSIESKHFDLILANPPFLNLIEFEDYRKQLEKRYSFVYHGKLDLCYYFLIKCLAFPKRPILNAFVLKRYFLKSPTAMKLRRVLKEYLITEIIDFRDQLVFSSANVETLLYLSWNLPNSAKINHIQYYYLSKMEMKLPLSQFSFHKNDLNIMLDRWILPESNSLTFSTQMKKRNSSWKTFFDYTFWDLAEKTILPNQNSSFTHIPNLSITLNKFKSALSQFPLFRLVKGIQTGKDKIFIVPKNSFKSKNDRIMPFLKGKDISAFHVHPNKYDLIISNQKYPLYPNEETRKKYPEIIDYLINHKSDLINRSRATGNDWGLWRKGDERFTIDFSKKKLIWPYRGNEFYTAIDHECSYHSQDIILFTLNFRAIEDIIPQNLFSMIVGLWETQMLYFYMGCMNSISFQTSLLQRAKEFAHSVKDFQPNNFKLLLLPLFNPSNAIHLQIMELAQKIETNALSEKNNKKLDGLRIALNALYNKL